MNDESGIVLVLYPQHQEGRHNSSMNAFYEQTMLSCKKNGWLPELACQQTYSKILKLTGLLKFFFEAVSAGIRRIFGWPGELIWFSIVHRVTMGIPNTISISQEYVTPFFLHKNVTIVHDMIQEDYPRSTFAKYYYLYYIRTLLKMTRCLFVSEYTRNILKPKNDNSPIIYNIFNHKKENELSFDKSIRKIYDVLWIGTLAKHKDIKTLISAAWLLPTVKFCVITPTHPLSKLPNNILVMTNVSNFDLELIYDQSRILISTSLAEGYGRPAMEARLKDISLILSDIPVFKEIHSGYAVFVKPEDPVLLAAAITGELDKIALNAKVPNPEKINQINEKTFSIDRYANVLSEVVK